MYCSMEQCGGSNMRTEKEEPEERRKINEISVRKMPFFPLHMLLCAGACILCAGCGKEENKGAAAAEAIARAREAETADTEEHVESADLELVTYEAEKKNTDIHSGEPEKEAMESGSGEVKTEADEPESGADMERNTGGEPETIEPEKTEPETPLLEQLFTCEEELYPSKQWSITGIAEEYEEHLWEYMEEICEDYDGKWYLVIPADINGIPVGKIAEGAFADRQMYGVLLPDSVEEIGKDAFRNTGLKDVLFSANLEYIGERAFENCNLERIAFPDKALVIEERAFAGSKKLLSVLIPDVETEMGENVFLDCAPDFCIYYGTGQDEKSVRLLRYAAEHGYDTVEVIATDEPFVTYHDEPLILKPEIRNFFYGDDEEDEDLWCSWEEDENAPNFGYPDWQWWLGCSSWCGCIDFENIAKASSELSSSDGRYKAENVLWQSREAAWAEGVEGPGIGESITYLQRCLYPGNRQWELFTPDNPEPVLNNLYHYSEICIVNGYAKNQKTWEENGRIKRFAMYVEGRLYAYLELEDTIFPQYFTLPMPDIIVPNGGMLEVRFEIEEVYPGSLYEDTCLTGLVMEFEGRSSH